MLKVNRKVEYGLVALRHMHAKPRGELTSVREICDQYGTPFDPVAHVLRILNGAGLVKSEQGAHGGYRLVADMAAVNFADFIEIIEGRLAFTDCLKGTVVGCNMREVCNIVSPMHMVHHRLQEFLRSITLEELIASRPEWMGGEGRPAAAAAGT